jgi:lysophospholipase L1-like esterase
MKKIFLLALVCAVLQFYSIAQVAPPFWNDIVAFRKHDSVQPCATRQILFVGSSSFTKWQDVNDYFPGYPIINRGFGGSTLLDLIRYAYDVILPYQPKQVVIYCGENDLAYSDSVSVSDVVNRFRTLYGIIRLNLPEASIDFVSIKPSPSRNHIRDKVIESNREIKAFLKKEKKAGYIDVYSSMIDAAGNPRGALFLEDSLHMKPEGYSIWGKIILPYLVK